MKTLFIPLFVLFYGAMASPNTNVVSMKKIEKNGMKIYWQVETELVHFEVFAPTKGWVAIGLNDQSGLVGNNLIMGNVIEDQVMISDRYIVGIGNHQAVEKLGGQSHLSNLEGKENTVGTTLKFSIKKEAQDQFHYDLTRDKIFYLLIAYSQADEFDHHSRMRTSVKIEL